MTVPTRPVARVTIRGKEYDCKMTFAACEAIETQLDCSIAKLVDRLSRGDIRNGDVATVLRETIIGAGERPANVPSRGDIGEALMDHGPQELYKAYASLIVDTVRRAAGIASKDADEGEATAT